MEEGKETKVRKAFIQALDDLMEAYGIADYAVVARTVTGDLDCTWVAGTGKDTISDRERSNVLYAEMARLQLDLLARTMPHEIEKPIED